jgi:kynurenine formamidase
MSQTAEPSQRTPISEPELAALFERCTNVGRWGADDERGTLNLITPAKRAAAARLVIDGRVVPLGRELRTEALHAGRSSVSHRMLDSGPNHWSALDAIEIAPHGYDVTHLDALGHVSLDGSIWNGREVTTELSAAGLRFASIRGAKDGIFTRGVMLDVAAVRSVPWLADTDVVTPDDLDRAEALAGVRLEAGDALVVRVGLGAREAVEGPEDPARRAGLNAACLGWIRDRDVAVYAGDCIEQRPSPYPDYPLPFHMVGMSGMGLALLDNPEVERLQETCHELRRWSFLLTCAPIVLAGATGSPVNPLAVF